MTEKLNGNINASLLQTLAKEEKSKKRIRWNEAFAWDIYENNRRKVYGENVRV